MLKVFVIAFAIYSIHYSSAKSYDGYKNHLAFTFPESKPPSIHKKILPIATSSAAIIVCTISTSPNVALADEIPYDRGQILFTQNCASCHVNGQNVMNPKRDLQKQTLLKYFSGTGDALEVDPIVSWIQKSGQHKRLFFPNVPGGKLDSEDYTSVISYILDQASNDKWSN